MPLVIKDADKEVYARFKAKAALKSLKIGEAITEAMKIWIEEENPLNSPKALQEKNNITYRRMINDLRKNNMNSWAAITDGDLLGIFADKKSALEAIYSKKNKINLIFQITEENPTRIVRLGIRKRVVA
ncbi:MAG: hypothetical protein KAT16_02490 [Candidatus Heimdallarchaeota archaeon]|nr:hypothetical protein [Candidatus Heimdallarchaeota archaeon]